MAGSGNSRAPPWPPRPARRGRPSARPSRSAGDGPRWRRVGLRPSPDDGTAAKLMGLGALDAHPIAAVALRLALVVPAAEPYGARCHVRPLASCGDADVGRGQGVQRQEARRVDAPTPAPDVTGAAPSSRVVACGASFMSPWSPAIPPWPAPSRRWPWECWARKGRTRCPQFVTACTQPSMARPIAPGLFSLHWPTGPA